MDTRAEMDQVILPGGLAWAIVAIVGGAFLGGVGSYWRMSNLVSAIASDLKHFEKEVDRIDKHNEKQDEHIGNLWKHMREV